MSISINAARRPMAMFDYSDDGKYVIASIMQHGDKFGVTEKIADEWLAHISQEALAGRYDPKWVEQFNLEYQAFLKGNELPREGTPIRTWASITREQGKRLISLNVTTVEDLAGYPDSGLGTIGLDGRYLRDLAKNFIEAGKGAGGMAKELADAKQLARDQADQIKRMQERLEALESPKRETLHAKKAA